MPGSRALRIRDLVAGTRRTEGQEGRATCRAPTGRRRTAGRAPTRRSGTNSRATRIERVLDRRRSRARADDDAELRLVVDLRARSAGARIGSPGPDQRVRPLREEERPLRKVDALLLGVVAVVEADADDLLREVRSCVKLLCEQRDLPRRAEPSISTSLEPELAQNLTRVLAERRRRLRDGGDAVAVGLERGARASSRSPSSCRIPVARVCSCSGGLRDVVHRRDRDAIEPLEPRRRRLRLPAARESGGAARPCGPGGQDSCGKRSSSTSSGRPIRSQSWAEEAVVRCGDHQLAVCRRKYLIRRDQREGGAVALRRAAAP